MRFGYAKHTLDRTHGAADSSAHCTADNTTDRTGHPIALVRALLRATDDALRVTGMR
jgi:hypothetical protein